MKNTPFERKAFQVSQIPWPIVRVLVKQKRNVKKVKVKKCERKIKVRK